MNLLKFFIFIFGLLIALITVKASNRRHKRMIGGQDVTDEKSFNYVVFIRNLHIDYQNSGQNLYPNTPRKDCTGSLIDKQFVITAAHCVLENDGSFTPGIFGVYSNATDLFSPFGVWSKVEEIYVPSSYDKTIGPYNDIAVLRLVKPLSHSVTLIKLPKKIKNLDIYADQDEYFQVAGYGYATNIVYNTFEYENDDSFVIGSTTRGNSKNILQYSNAKIVSQSDCNIIWHEYLKITDSLICVRTYPVRNGKKVTGHHGVCQGDSGGPLVLNGELVGVLSQTNVMCDERYNPAVYIKVDYFLKFINNSMQNLNSTSIRSYRPPSYQPYYNDFLSMRLE